MKPLALATICLAIVVSACVGSASATALCPTEGKSSCLDPYLPETPIAGTGSASFETNLGSVTCKEANIGGATTEEATEGGAALNATISSFKFNGCSLKETSCTLSPVNMPYGSSIKWTEGNNGTMLLKKASGTPGVSFKCGVLVDCVVSGEPTLDVNGGTVGKASIVASKEKLTPGEKTCFKEINWSETYTVTEPAGGLLFVANTAPFVTICQENTFPCPPEVIYANNSVLKGALSSGAKAKLKVKITTGGVETEFTIPCESSSLEALLNPTQARPVRHSAATLKFDECGATCAVTVSEAPFSGKILADGTMRIERGVNAEPKVQVFCIGAYKCTYKGPIIAGTITGGQPATLSLNASLGTLVPGESEAKCTGAQLKIEGAYTFSEPKVGAVAKMWITT